MQEEFNLTCQQLKEKTLTLGEITEHETRAQNETIVAESSGIQDQGYEEIFIESPTTSPVPTQALTVSDENEIDWDNEDTEYWNRLNNQPAQINNLLTTPSPYQRFNLFQGGGLVFSNNPSSSNTNKNIPK